MTEEPGGLLGCTESDMTELSSTLGMSGRIQVTHVPFIFFPILSLTTHLVLFRNQCLLSNFNVATC